MCQHQYQKCYEVVAYTYEAAMHCPTCAMKRFGLDEYGYVDGIDNEGNPVHAVFAGDEREYVEYCHDCGEVIE